VLVVDDSALVRRALSDAIGAASDMEVAGTAADPFEAREKILALNPDVLTLDLEMPRMGGLSFLRQLMQHHPLPVVVISSLTGPSCDASIEALRLGAVDVMAKPCGSYSVGSIAAELPGKLRAAARTRPYLARRVHPEAAARSGKLASLESHRGRETQPDLPLEDPRSASGGLAGNRKALIPVHPEPKPSAIVPLQSRYRAGTDPDLIALGASTGGTEAIALVLEALPRELPGIVIAQHIPAGFSLAFAQRLDRCCALEVREASDGDEIRPGLALVAPGNFHMVVRRSGKRLFVQVIDGPLVCYQRPSIDVLFHSAVKARPRAALGLLLTGMGTDGAQGLLAMRSHGACTIAQDEKTCVVFGMPKEAIRLGGAEKVVGLPAIAASIVDTVNAPSFAGSANPRSVEGRDDR
jgi:two-component system chemotaxis response regulator CheB